VSALEKRCSGMADRCDDLMGKYESMLRRTTQVEVSVGLMRSRFETYPPQQFNLTVLEEDVLDIPITLGNHVVASGPRTLEERIELGRDWEQWLVSVGDVEEECQGGPRRSPEIQLTLVWSSCWGATGSAGRSTQRGEQRRVVRTRGNKGEVGVTRDQCRVW